VNALFVHDHLFKRRQNTFYSSGGFPAQIWSRYLSVFEKLTVVGRNGGELSEEGAAYSVSSVESVHFQLLPDLSNLKSLIFGNLPASEMCIDLVAQHDAVIARLPSRLGQLFIKEAVRQNKLYAIEVVACPWDSLWNYGSWKGKMFAPLATWDLKRAVEKAPFVLYVTNRFLQRRYPCKNGQTIACSNVEIPVVDETVLLQRLEKIKSPGSLITIGLIGSYVSKHKGIDVAIRALAAVNSRLPAWELQIVGSGDATGYQELANRLGVADKIRFVGTLPSGQPVYDWLDNVDIYLQPSFVEGLPRALIEAMSRGCPALATSVGGMPDLLEPQNMVRAGDESALTRSILRLAQSAELREEAAKQNFAKAKNYYKTILDERRFQFWTAFRNSIGSSG
jgi:glycosyltransferase involved in cell wall biosynthesis